MVDALRLSTLLLSLYRRSQLAGEKLRQQAGSYRRFVVDFSFTEYPMGNPGFNEVID
jgi:hypothetical protein